MIARTRKILVASTEVMILVVLVIVASYVSIGRILTRNIESFHSDIEVALSGALNVPVTIGKLAGDFRYIDPEFTLSGLSIGDAISVNHISAKLDALASLLELGPVVGELSVDGLKFDLAQDDAGRWYVERIPTRGGKFNPDPLLDSMNYIQSLKLSEVDVGVTGKRHHYRLSNQPEHPFVLLSEGRIKRLAMPLLWQKNDGIPIGFELVGSYRGDPRASNLYANLYLQLPAIDIADFLPATTGEITLRDLMVGGEFWLDVRPDGFEMRGSPSLAGISLERNGKDIVIGDSATATLVAWGTSIADLQVYVSKLDAKLDSHTMALEGINFAMGNGTSGLEMALRLPLISITDVSAMAMDIGTKLELLPASALADVKTINPRGRLTNVLVSAPVHGFVQGLMAVATVTDAEIGALRGSPGFSALNGFVKARREQGFMDVHNDAFSMAFALFPESWSLDSAEARIHYKVSPGYFQVTSERIALTQGSLSAAGRFHLNIPVDSNHRTWGLEIGITDADLLDAHRFLPNTLSDELIEWLNRAVVAGTATQAGLLFHGTLDKTAPQVTKAYDLYFKVRDASLDYAPDWPVIRDLAATIGVGSWGVYSGDASGKAFDSEIVGGRVTIPVRAGKPADTILIHGDVRGPLSDGMKVLIQTPVAEMTNRMAEGWEASGVMKAALDLNVPIGARKDERVAVDVTVNLADNRVFMAPYSIDVKDLRGAINFNTKRGLSSKQFTASLFDYPVKGRIGTEVAGDGGVVRVGFDGKVDVGDLYTWSGQTLLTRASGTAPYSAELNVPYGSRAGEPGYIEAKSTLEGVVINLPAPMKKDADAEMAMIYRQSFLKPGFRLDMGLGELTHASFKVLDGAVMGGRLHFGPEPGGAVAYNDIEVSGKLDLVNYEEWRELTRFMDKKTDVSLPSELASRLEAIDVQVASLNGFGLELRNVDTYITRSSDAWQVKLTSEILAGEVLVPDAPGKPLDVSLDYLRFTGGKTEEVDAGDPLGEMLPGEFIPVRFKVSELTLDDENYGAWSFNFKPSATGAVMDDLAAEVKGLLISNQAKVSWSTVGGQHETAFEGTIKVPDLALAFREWGFAPSIEGQGFRLDAKVSWPGSPAMFDIESIRGLVRLSEGKGRFVQAESGTGALRLLGVFDFASLSRRLRLDFSDVVDSGFTFSEARGEFRFDAGTLSVAEPMVIVGSGSTFKVGGTVDLRNNTLDSDMIVTLPVGRNLPWYAAYSAIATGPLVGAGVWLAQKVFADQIDQMSSAKYKITGPLDKPDVKFVSMFSDSVRESPVEAEPAVRQEPAAETVAPEPVQSSQEDTGG